MPSEKFEVDPSTIRSKEQFEATKKAAECGCAWCQPEENQKSPVLFESNLVVIRRNVFAKPGRDMYIIHLRRHASLSNITADEALALVRARQHLIDKHNLPGGGFIHRFGDKQYNASSLPDDHYFESVVVPHGTEKVAETLCKDVSPEKVAKREERAATFK